MRFQITGINILDKEIQLSKSTENNDNIYTLITGKNGLGKTRLLNCIIINYLKSEYKNYQYYVDKKYSDFVISENMIVKSNKKPEKIIAHTNSAYNRFPGKDNILSEKYDTPSSRVGYYNEENIFFKILFSKNINYKSVNDTLSYLGYDSKINFIFFLKAASNPKGYLDFVIKKHKEALKRINFNCDIPTQSLSKFEKKFLNLLYVFEEERVKNVTDIEIEQIYNIVKSNNIFGKSRYLHGKSIQISIDVKTNKIFYEILQKSDFSLLIKLNLLRINSIYLHNLKPKNDLFNSNEQVNFNNLSSGQKSIINTLIGISSCIEDNSLICIDEPEISLHPEWQEEIISKLQDVFQDIKGCHFLIATHSPQVVSGLKAKNGFIVNLETMEMHHSIEYFHKSADFQLANIFNTPGYNNEYLIRISLVILSKLTKNENLSLEDQEHLKILNYIHSKISENDPVYYLIKQVLTMVE